MMSSNAARQTIETTRPKLPNPHAIGRAVRASGLTPAEKLITEAILDHAGHGRGICTASLRTIARETGLSERHVQRCILAPVKLGWIVMERATGSMHSRCKFTAGPLVHAVGQAEQRPTACSRTSAVHAVGQAEQRNVPLHAGARPETGIEETSTTTTGDARTEESKTAVDMPPITPRVQGLDPICVPAAVVAEIETIVSKVVAEEVRTHPAQCHKAAGGVWENLLAGARATRSALRSDRPIKNSFGFMVAKALEFATQGIPERFKTARPVVAAPPSKPVEMTAEQKAEDEAKLAEELAKIRAQFPALAL